MNKQKPDLKTWWWYHKTHVLIGAAALAVVLYAVVPGLLAAKPDYCLAIVSKSYVSDETREAVRKQLQPLLPDRNGDGQVLLEVYYYGADLSGATEGSLNYAEAAKLDADLVGKVSGFFLLDDADGFQRNTAVPAAQPVPCAQIPAFVGLSLPEGWTFTARTDTDAFALFPSLLSP